MHSPLEFFYAFNSETNNDHFHARFREWAKRFALLRLVHFIGVVKEVVDSREMTIYYWPFRWHEMTMRWFDLNGLECWRDRESYFETDIWNGLSRFFYSFPEKWKLQCVPATHHSLERIIINARIQFVGRLKCLSSVCLCQPAPIIMCIDGSVVKIMKENNLNFSLNESCLMALHWPGFSGTFNSIN